MQQPSPMPRLSQAALSAPDPRRAYHSVRNGAPLAGSKYAAALHWLLTDSDSPEFPRDSFDEDLLGGVERAWTSYHTPAAQWLFDAALLARATDEDLAAFGVTPAEAAAYRALFFDRSVFPNDFHVIAYIQSALQVSPLYHELLELAHTGGISALHVRYAGHTAISPTAVVENMLSGDARQYFKQQGVAAGHRAVKDVRALGKQVLDAVQVANALVPAKGAQTDAEPAQYVIQRTPPNPAITQLIELGIEFTS